MHPLLSRVSLRDDHCSGNMHKALPADTITRNTFTQSKTPRFRMNAHHKIATKQIRNKKIQVLNCVVVTKVKIPMRAAIVTSV